MIERPRPTEGTLLALDGALPSARHIITLRERYTALVAADGAATRLHDLGIRPDLVIGDLDGIGARRGELERAGVIVVEEPDQESGDLEKAILWILGRGETRIDIIGLSGGMTDHILNNFSIIARYAGRLSLRSLEEESTTWFVSTSLELAPAVGDRISLLPLPYARLSTSGLQWELRDERLGFGEREGGSNRAVGARVGIEVADGVVAVMHYGEKGT